MSRPDDVNTRIFCELMIFQTPCDFPCGSDSVFACLEGKVSLFWLQELLSYLYRQLPGDFFTPFSGNLLTPKDSEVLLISTSNELFVKNWSCWSVRKSLLSLCFVGLFCTVYKYFWNSNILEHLNILIIVFKMGRFHIRKPA